MAVRNFWLEANVDGYKTVMKGGPRSKSDGLEIKLSQRNKGGIIETAVKIDCFVDLKDKNKLITQVKDKDGNIVFEFVSER